MWIDKFKERKIEKLEKDFKELRNLLLRAKIIRYDFGGYLIEDKFAELFVEPTVSMFTGNHKVKRVCDHFTEVPVIKDIPVTKAVKMLIDHLDLTLDYQPEQKEEIKGFKKRTKKVVRKKK